MVGWWGGGVVGWWGGGVAGWRGGGVVGYGRLAASAAVLTQFFLGSSRAFPFSLTKVFLFFIMASVRSSHLPFLSNFFFLRTAKGTGRG